MSKAIAKVYKKEYNGYILTIEKQKFTRPKLLDIQHKEYTAEQEFDKRAEEGQWDIFIEIKDNEFKIGNLSYSLRDIITSTMSNCDKRLWMQDVMDDEAGDIQSMLDDKQLKLSDMEDC